MKKVLIICTMLAALCCLIAYAGTNANVYTLGADNSKAPAVVEQQKQAPVAVVSPKERLTELYQELLSAKAAGQHGLAQTYSREIARLEAQLGIESIVPTSGRDTNPLDADEGGIDCANAFAIPSIPYSDLGGTVAGATDDDDGSCAGTFSTGPDKWYSFTVPNDGSSHCYEIILDDTNPAASEYPAVSLYDGCGGNCLAGDWGNDQAVIECMELEAGTYYISVDNYPTPDLTGYDLYVNECECPAACTAHHALTDEGSVVDADGSCGDGATYNNGCLGSYDGGEENIIEWTVTADGMYEIQLDSPTTYTGIAVAYDCEATNCIDFVTGSGSGVKTIDCQFYAAGTYFIFVDTWPAPNCLASYTVTTIDCSNPAGRCCYQDTEGRPACANISEAECLAEPYSGTWTAGITCDVPCDLNDNCETSTVVPGLPYNDTGNTCVASNDYDAACTGTSNSPDVAYSYTPVQTELVSMNLCASLYDTKIFVYDASNIGPGLHIYCNDDTPTALCPGATQNYRSYLECVELIGGTTYCIVIDGYSGDCGDYVFSMEECIVNDCDGYELCGTPAETEPNDDCGEGIDPLVLSCDAQVSGKVCPVGESDFFQVNVPTNTILTIYLLDGEGCAAPASCVDFNLYDATCTLDNSGSYGYALGGAGVPAATWYVEVTGGLATCTTTYTIFVECCEISNCFDAILIDAGLTEDGNYFYTDTQFSCCWENTVPAVNSDMCTGSSDYASGPDVIYAISEDVPFTIDSIYVLGGDTQWMIFTDCADPLGTCVASSDNEISGGEHDYAISLPAGNYYLSISYYGSACGDITLGIWADDRLPVELTSFDAVAGDGMVELTWATASETETDHYNVMRDGERIGEVNAENDVNGGTYSFVDNNIDNGRTCTYTVMTVDVSGAEAELFSIDATPSFGAAAVTEYALHQNFPNPFNPETNITFDLVDAGFVKLSVYNLLGQEVSTVVNRTMEAGRHIVSFDAANLPSGLYIYRMEANGFSAQKKMVLMK